MIKFYTEERFVFSLKYCIDCIIQYKILQQSIVLCFLIVCDCILKKLQSFFKIGGKVMVMEGGFLLLNGKKNV